MFLVRGLAESKVLGRVHFYVNLTRPINSRDYLLLLQTLGAVAGDLLRS